MLFNSYIFIFAFLPLTVIGFYLIGGRGHHRVAISWLVMMSLLFYGYWNVNYLWLILFSMFFNYSIGILVNSGDGKRKSFLIFGIAVNLALIGFYKYANFFVDSFNYTVGSDYNFEKIILPLAISFFTFQQISYLVDTYKQETKEYSFLHYALFVTFFPQLIAGPIVHHKEMLPQFKKDENYKFTYRPIVVGVTLFTLGLFKKVVIADNISDYANPVFSGAMNGHLIGFFDGWVGAFAYTAQLYFDFSGYSDMAIGLGMMFGIKLPVNFHSPYKATNIIDFWRRWHITLSRFLRDYVYIPLGGNRLGPVRRYTNIMITMILGGMWHGAGWTFIFWGGLHGVYLCLNHFFHSFRKSLLGHDIKLHTTIGVWCGRVLTLGSVTLAWVYFRAESFASANNIAKGMLGMQGASLPAKFEAKLGSGFSEVLTDLGIKFEHTLVGGTTEFGVLIFVLLILWFAPNVGEMMRGEEPYINTYGRAIEEPKNKFFLWEPTAKWAFIVAICLLISILYLTRVQEFLYFQF